MALFEFGFEVISLASSGLFRIWRICVVVLDLVVFVNLAILGILDFEIV